ESSFCACENFFIAAGSLTASGGTLTEVAFARACVTPRSTSFSCAAYPCTVATRLGIRSARRLYWLSTSDHAAFTCSSLDWMSLYPQPDSMSDARSVANHTSLRMNVSPELFGAPAPRYGDALARVQAAASVRAPIVRLANSRSSQAFAF